DGHFEFVITRGRKKVCIVEEKKDDFDQGLAQGLLGCEAFADIESLSSVYGIVTNYLTWVFIQNLDDAVERDMQNFLMEGEGGDEASKEGLRIILGKIFALLSD
ncbi:hypothetical protein BGX38DRAFT_1090825, partial [Terfezia claveryi]